MKLKCDKTSEIVREMTDSEKAESIIKLINDYDINSTFLFGWQIEFIEKLCRKQLNNGWIPCSRELPKEYLCKDGEYDPSDYVLVQLDNGYMKVSRYWNHRHCKDIIIEQPWLDLETWENVMAWQPLPEKYKEISE